VCYLYNASVPANAQLAAHSYEGSGSGRDGLQTRNPGRTRGKSSSGAPECAEAEDCGTETV
jgi:hypothetical protein